ncbi:MAG TPA: ATP-binding protein, partial [Abditibacteriaceae bacterium]|nr:ATP-binding protein [Abditibacteriaceae bacterium]
GRPLPPQMGRLVTQALSQSTLNAPRQTSATPGKTANAAQRDTRPILLPSGDSVFGAQGVRGAAGARYVLAAEMPRLQIRVIGAPLSLPVNALLPDTLMPALEPAGVGIGLPPVTAQRDVVTYAAPSPAELRVGEGHESLSTDPGPPGRQYFARRKDSPANTLAPAIREEKVIPHFGVPWPVSPWSYPLRWLALVLTASAVCYGLARYLAAPAVTLRAATSRLAEGDLSARVGPAMGRRRDELADLGRDFDRMAERIETLVQSERRLLADISHELRSPLARLTVALELARQDAGDKAQPSLQRIDFEAEKINELIGQLLTLTQLESGVSASSRQSVDITALVRDIASDAAFEARGHDRDVCTGQLEPARVDGVPHLLRSAIENVVRNAVRYTEEKTSVEIEVECPASLPDSVLNSVLIRVRDRGPGVPAAALTHLFQPFYRVDAARDEHSGGTGLGLSITERAVRLHGGTVRAANAPEGGLVVEIRLPAGVEAEPVSRPYSVTSSAT